MANGSSPSYDVVIVGARCAGASLATFLARSGARVLLVDRDALPSDQVLSTHTIHPPGVDLLDDLGVGEAVRAVAPENRTVRLRKGESWADITFPEGRVEICPRRMRLDSLIQEAAMAAGAELRDRTRATRVLFEGERAVGIEVENGERREEIRAGLVVGADGRRSFVAGQVGAEEYLGYDAPRGMYWAYWHAPEAWQAGAYPFDAYIGRVGDDVRVVFQTDHGQLLIGSLPPAAVAASWRSDPRAGLLESLAGDDVIGPMVDGFPPASTVRGTFRERYFFRRGAGPGWALAGDAGHHKEFVIGDGITEALLQARSLATAIAEGSDAALVRWWRARDVEALPGYFWGRDEGTLGPPSELEEVVVARVGRSRVLQQKMTRLPEHEVSPYAALPLGALLPTLLAALFRGRFGVVPEFLAMGRRATEYKKELAERRALLAEAESRVTKEN